MYGPNCDVYGSPIPCHTQMPHREFPFWFTYTWRGISLPLYGYGNKEDALHDTQQLHQVGQTCNSLLKLESACHRPPDGNLFWLSQNSSGVVPKLLVKVKDLTTTHSITVLDICTYKHISGCYHQIHNTVSHTWWNPGPSYITIQCNTFTYL